MSQVHCMWCTKLGHVCRYCHDLKTYKKTKTPKEQRGHHSPYEKPQRGAKRPTRSAGSVDAEGDWDEVIGLTGDQDVDAGLLHDATVEQFNDSGKDFADLSEFKDDEQDADGVDWEDTCTLTDEQP